MRLDELGPEAGRAVREAARRVQRPEITAVRSWRRRRNGLATGVTAFIGTVAVVGAVALWPSGGGSEPAAPPATTTTIEPVAPIEPSPPSDTVLTVHDAVATPVSVLSEHTIAGVTWRLTERGSSAGRCLELTAVVNDTVHSRGGSCHFAPDPSAGAWDLENPIRFSISDSTFTAFFGRAGADVSVVRVAEIPSGVDTDVADAWLVVAEVTDPLAEVLIESLDGDGEILLSERVPINTMDATILDVEGLIAELRIAGATVDRLPSEPSEGGSPFFTAEAVEVDICVNSRQVRLYEYPSEVDRQRDSDSITTEGQIQGPGRFVIVEWIGAPSFFAGGRLIVLHLGEDLDTLTLLTNILGSTLSPDGVGSRGNGYLPCENKPQDSSSASTSSTTTMPGGQVEPTDLESQDTGNFVYLTTDTQLTVIDVDNASVAVHEIPELAPGDPLFRVVRRGELLAFYGHTATDSAVFALDPDRPQEPMLVSEAWFFLPSDDDERLWLAILDPTSPDTVRALAAVREVTVDGTTVVDDVTPPDGRWPVGAVSDGLLFQGEATLELWDPTTEIFVDSLPGPFPVATWRNRIVSCGDCDQLHLIDLDAGTQRIVSVPEGVAAVDGYGGVFSPDGRYVAVPGYDTPGDIDQSAVSLVLIDFDTATATVVPGSRQAQWDYPQAAWSSDSEWVFFSNGGQLLAYEPDDDSAYRVAVELNGPYYGMAAR
jgi:hypothetical protein